MARRRQSRTNNNAKPREKEVGIAQLVRQQVAERIERARRRRDAERRAARAERHVPKDMIRSATKAERDELREHGFRVTKTGVVVDGPRDSRRKPIKGARFQVVGGGVVKTSVGERRDFIYGFTKKEKKLFADNPEAFTLQKLAELKKRFPSMRGRKRQVRLQWGAYQATKDFAPSYFTAKYFLEFAEHRPAKGKKRPKKIDTLTGLHIVIHVPKTHKKTNAKKKKGKKK